MVKLLDIIKVEFQERVLHVARSRSIVQAGNEPEKEAVGVRPMLYFCKAPKRVEMSLKSMLSIVRFK